MPPYGILPAAKPDPFAYQNTQAFMKILQTLGDFETIRQKKMMNTNILSILQGGGDPQKTPMENIAGVIQQHQQPQFDTGVRGLFQRISAPFAQQPGAGITDMLLKGTVSQAMKVPTMADIRMNEYVKALTAGDTERAERLLMSSLVTIQTGEKLLTAEQRQALADKDFVKEMGLSEAQRNTARKSVKTIISEMSHGTWLGDMKGFKNFKRNNLIQGYEQYRTENDYASKSTEHQKWLDDNWDSQMTTYNKAGYKDHGKNEFDWDPKDDRVKELRGKPLEVYKGVKDKTAHQKIIRIWGDLSKEMQAQVTALRATGASWEEIITADDLKPYLGK